ncbi:MAG TPA: FGGY-family carbohydrate kinase [Dongiaceae bacterium]|jgi:sugar (pentulose or hexulose) kinase|nr:FGGY-family carbohydrate kinase [Dongiaceae bacterium]
MTDELFLGIDVGTGGVRACAIDAAARIAGLGQAPLPPPRQDGEAIDQEPELWWQGVKGAVAALGRHVELGAIRRVAVDGTSGTLLLADRDGRPLSPGLMYNDARAAWAARRIAEIAPADSGAHGRSSALAKLMHLVAGQPSRSPRHAAHQADWIAGRLTGRFNCSDENNALKLGYDPIARAWPDWLDRVGLSPSHFPKVLVPGTEIGPITAAMARETGLPETARVHAGTTDGVAAFIATRASALGDAVTSLGTTLVVKLLSDKPIFAAGQGIYSHRLGEKWLAGGASNAGGAALLAHFTADRMAALTPGLRPEQPTGLDYYPLPKPGERFPIADPALPPRVAPRPADDAAFFQGLLEGIASIEALAYRRLAELGAPALRRVVSIGGGAKNAAWSRIRERVLGVPVERAEQTEASYGAALLALHAGPP